MEARKLFACKTNKVAASISCTIVCPVFWLFLALLWQQGSTSIDSFKHAGNWVRGSGTRRTQAKQAVHLTSSRTSDREANCGTVAKATHLPVVKFVTVFVFYNCFCTKQLKEPNF